MPWYQDPKRFLGMCMHSPCLQGVDLSSAQRSPTHCLFSDVTCVLNLPVDALCCAVLCCAQEMTLEQYEAMLAEKKAELNKARVVKTIDTSEFENLKVVNKDEEEEENPLEVRALI